MAKNPYEPLRELIYQAAAEPIGLVVRTEDFAKAKQRLYALQRTDPTLGDLQFRASPWPEQGDLVIVHRRILLPGPPAPTTSLEDQL